MIGSRHGDHCRPTDLVQALSFPPPGGGGSTRRGFFHRPEGIPTRLLRRVRSLSANLCDGRWFAGALPRMVNLTDLHYHCTRGGARDRGGVRLASDRDGDCPETIARSLAQWLPNLRRLFVITHTARHSQVLRLPPGLYRLVLSGVYTVATPQVEGVLTGSGRARTPGCKAWGAAFESYGCKSTRVATCPVGRTRHRPGHRPGTCGRCRTCPGH